MVFQFSISQLNINMILQKIYTNSNALKKQKFVIKQTINLLVTPHNN